MRVLVLVLVPPLIVTGVDRRIRGLPQGRQWAAEIDWMGRRGAVTVSFSLRRFEGCMFAGRMLA